jgi:hypothetical protein
MEKVGGVAYPQNWLKEKVADKAAFIIFCADLLDTKGDSS